MTLTLPFIGGMCKYINGHISIVPFKFHACLSISKLQKISEVASFNIIQNIVYKKGKMLKLRA